MRPSTPVRRVDNGRCVNVDSFCWVWCCMFFPNVGRVQLGMKWQLIFLQGDVKHFVSLNFARSHCTCCFLAKSTLHRILWIDPVISENRAKQSGSVFVLISLNIEHVAWCYVFQKSFLSSCLWRFHRFRAAFCLEYVGLVEFKVMCICYGDESYQRGDRCKQRVERNGQVTRPGVDRWADFCKPGILPSRREHFYVVDVYFKFLLWGIVFHPFIQLHHVYSITS